MVAENKNWRDINFWDIFTNKNSVEVDSANNPPHDETKDTRKVSFSTTVEERTYNPENPPSKIGTTQRETQRGAQKEPQETKHTPFDASSTNNVVQTFGEWQPFKPFLKVADNFANQIIKDTLRTTEKALLGPFSQNNQENQRLNNRNRSNQIQENKVNGAPENNSQKDAVTPSKKPKNPLNIARFTSKEKTVRTKSSPSQRSLPPGQPPSRASRNSSTEKRFGEDVEKTYKNLGLTPEQKAGLERRRLKILDNLYDPTLDEFFENGAKEEFFDRLKSNDLSQDQKKALCDLYDNHIGNEHNKNRTTRCNQITREAIDEALNPPKLSSQKPSSLNLAPENLRQVRRSDGITTEMDGIIFSEGALKKQLEINNSGKNRPRTNDPRINSAPRSGKGCKAQIATRDGKEILLSGNDGGRGGR